MYNQSKIASGPLYQLVIDGKEVKLSADDIAHVMRKKLAASTAIQRIFDRFGISIDRISELKIEFMPLEKKYAETNIQGIQVNETMLQTPDFIDKYAFVFAHEIVHWLTRIKEEEAYFNDPEETLGFIASVAYELEQTRDLNEVWNKIYNKINWHFNDEKDARQFFENMVDKAKELLQ